MAKQRKSSLDMLLKRWEKTNAEDLQRLVVQTSVYLASVQDVPRTVINALDGVGNWENPKLGTHVFDVVRFLRELQRIEKLSGKIPTEDPLAGNKATQKS